MAKKKEKKEEEPKVLEEVKQATSVKKEGGGRERRWKDLLDAYKVQNPVKYESKKANGEFKNIPDSFK